MVMEPGQYDDVFCMSEHETDWKERNNGQDDIRA